MGFICDNLNKSVSKGQCKNVKTKLCRDNNSFDIKVGFRQESDNTDKIVLLQFAFLNSFITPSTCSH